MLQWQQCCPSNSFVCSLVEVTLPRSSLPSLATALFALVQFSVGLGSIYYFHSPPFIRASQLWGQPHSQLCYFYEVVSKQGSMYVCVCVFVFNSFNPGPNRLICKRPNRACLQCTLLLVSATHRQYFILMFYKCYSLGCAQWMSAYECSFTQICYILFCMLDPVSQF